MSLTWECSCGLTNMGIVDAVAHDELKTKAGLGAYHRIGTSEETPKETHTGGFPAGTQYEYELYDPDLYDPPDYDPVDRPEHYNKSNLECIDAMAHMLGDNFRYYLQGNVFKYLWRHEYKKKPTEDIKKALDYLTRLQNEIERLSDASSDETTEPDPTIPTRPDFWDSTRAPDTD